MKQVLQMRKNHEQTDQLRDLTIKAIFFDLDHTLIDCESADLKTYEIVSQIARSTAVTIHTPALIHEFRKLLGDIPFDPEGIIDVHTWRTGLWQKALAIQGINHPDLPKQLNTVFHNERLAFYLFAPNVYVMIKDLLQSYTGIIITNGDATIQRPKLAACNAESLFGSNVIVGGEEPDEKPHPTIFYKACEMANCVPDEAMMVGDRLKTDISGGILAGLGATVWVNPKNLPVYDNDPIPDFQVLSVLELPSILEHLRK
jgi:N-acylneuraminate-9-phosphatase